MLLSMGLEAKQKAMKYLIPLLILFFITLFSHSSFAVETRNDGATDPAEKSELYNFVDLYAGVGFAFGEGSWEISFPAGAGLTGRSKLEFEDIDGTLYIVGAKIKPYFYFLTIDARYGSGDIRSGTTIDSDWLGSFLFSRSESDADGDVEYFALDMFVLLYPLRGKPAGWGKSVSKPRHHATLEAFFGWFYYEDRIDITNGVQVIPPSGPFSGLDSDYEFGWEGFRTGLLYEWDFIKKPSRFRHALGIRAWGAYLWAVDYEGEGIWNLRTDLAQNPSFAHDADGDGFEGQIGLFYSPLKHFKMELAYKFLSLRAEDGTDTTFFSNGTIAEVNLDKVHSKRHGVLLLLSCYF
jgi:hypothetical protein